MDTNTTILFDSFIDLLTMHPLLASILAAYLLVILLLPYRFERHCDDRGREYGCWESLLYRYAYGPTYEYLIFYGLRDVQRAILDLLRAAWFMLRGDLLRRLVAEVRRWLAM